MASNVTLIKILEDATSQNPETFKTAEEQLKAWEEQPNFYQAILISVQLAVVIGRIARTDLRLWPDLIPTLLQEVKSSDIVVQQNALLTLNHVIKGLIHLAESNIKMNILILKVLRKLIVEGHDQSNECSGVILLEVQKRHPLLFIYALENSLKMAINYIFNLSQKDLLFDEFTVQCCNLLRSIVRCKEYSIKGEGEIEDNAQRMVTEAQKIITNILTPGAVKEFCRQLILRYFPLKTHELEEWENDPEEYLAVEAGIDDNSLLNPCTESLFLAFFYEYRAKFHAVTSEMLFSLTSSHQDDNFEQLINREAVYYALGLASYELFGDLNFDQFFQTSLIKELKNLSPRFKVIRRRVLWLIGRWINVSFSNESRVLLYEIISEMLSGSEDLVVRITAAQTLKDAVDEYQFKKEDILQFLETIWGRLFHLLIDVKQNDTKMNILNVISILIERIGSQIKQMQVELCEYLPHLWNDSSEHNMLRCLVLTTLSHLVKAFGSESKQLQQFILPIIQFSTDLQKPAHIYLLDDGLELWLKLMENASSMTNELLVIFAVLPTILEQVSENFRISISIMKSYMLLDPVSVLRMHSDSLLTIVESLIGQLKTEGNILIAELIEIIFIALPIDGPVLFQNIMVKLFKVVMSDEEYPQVVISYLTLFGYNIFNNLPIFNEIVQKACQDQPEETEEIAGKFFDIWLEKVDAMRNDETRKLTTMAFMSILPLNANFVNQRFALVLDTAVNALYDLAKGTDNQNSVASDELDNDEEDSMEIRRQQMLRNTNPVVTTSLLEFVKTKLAETKVSLGDQRFHKLMDTMDPVIGRQLISIIS
eukprot:gene9834-10843_t